MIGFTTEYAGGRIKIQKQELEDARWFTAADLPPALSAPISISRWLVDSFLAQQESRL